MATVAKTAKSKLALLSLFLLWGCASQLQTLTPATNFLTPETQGKTFEKLVSFGAIEGASVHSTLKKDTEKLEFSSGKNFAQFFAMPQVGLIDRVDAFVRLSSHSPFLYGLKWQVFGESRTEARRGSESFSLYMSGGRHRYQGPSEFNIEQGGDFKANRTHTMIDYGLLYGKRLYSDILSYFRYSKISQEVHGDIEFEDNANLDGAQFDLEGDHTSYGLGIIWYTEKLNLGIELAHLHAKWKEAPNSSSTSLMLSLSTSI